MNLCTSCGIDFSSLRSFEKHRVGKHAYTQNEGLAMNPARNDGRRCLTLDELRAAGFVQNSRGRWGPAQDMERARQRFSVQPRTPRRHRKAA